MSISAMVESTANSIISGQQVPPIPPVPPVPPVPSNPGRVTANSVEQITRYIPTEIVTTYVTVVAVMKQEKAEPTAQWVVFYVLLALTPIVTWLLLVAKLRSKGMTIKDAFKEFPLWKCIAATIAFVAWAYVLPNGAFSTLASYNGSYAAIALSFATLALGTLGGLFDPIT